MASVFMDENASTPQHVFARAPGSSERSPPPTTALCLRLKWLCTPEKSGFHWFTAHLRENFSSLDWREDRCTARLGFLDSTRRSTPTQRHARQTHTRPPCQKPTPRARSLPPDHSAAATGFQRVCGASATQRLGNRFFLSQGLPIYFRAASKTVAQTELGPLS